MADSQTEQAEEATEQNAENGIPPETRSARDKSEVKFPYAHLEDAIKVPRAIFERSGQQAGLVQLASWLGHGSTTTGAFRTKIGAATLFGLIEYEKGEARLTDLGSRILDPEAELVARVQAFLSVPLFKAIYDKYRGGKVLPPDSALETEILALGAAPKQKTRARQVFQRSAQQAGLFNSGKDRLILPAGVTESMLSDDAAASRQREPKNPPMIVERKALGELPGQLLLGSLPAPGEELSEDARRMWHRMADIILDQCYQKKSS
jgi:hypothetical protein